MTHRISQIVCALMMVAVLTACKNDAKTSDTTDAANQETAVPEKKELTEQDKLRISSVMTKVMMTPELKTFSSTLVSAQMADMLSTQEGPFTVLAPSSDAFAAVPKETMNGLTNPANIAQLEGLLKNHIVEGSMDSVSLVQRIKQEGSMTLTTLGGASLTATMDGNDIVIATEGGGKAVVGKSDITGSNGVVHVLDQVLIQN